MTTWITVCDTCKTAGWEETGMEKTDGEALAELVEAAAAGTTDVKTRRVSCTMGCDRACNITVQSSGKINYSLGTFAATAEDAEAIVEYAGLHAASETGQVPYREWPQGVKGHFVSRHQPLPE
jgi:predicted metal-binding protein